MLGSMEAYQEVLKDTYELLPERMRQLKVCFTIQDLKGLEGHAHNLAGLAGYIQATALCKAARVLQQQAKGVLEQGAGSNGSPMAASRSEGTEAVHHMYAQFVEEAEHAISAMRQKLARQVQ